MPPLEFRSVADHRNFLNPRCSRALLDDMGPLWHHRTAMATDVQAPDAALVERERVMRALREHEAELRALGVTRLWLFGSLARGDPGRRSDVDVLISVPPAQKFSLLDLAGVRVELCDAARPRHRCRHSRRRAATVLGDDQGRSRRGVLMPRAPVADRLRHMLDAIARIETLTGGKSFEDYAADWVIRDAVERNLERVSEASRHVPSDLKSQHKNVPWRAVAGLGNVLRHDYPRVKDPRVWRIVSHDLAPLKAAVEAMLQEIDGNALEGPEPARRRAFATPVSQKARESCGRRVRSAWPAAWVRSCARVARPAARVGFVRPRRARVRSDAMRQGFRRPGPIGPRRAHDTAPALTMAPCSPGMFTGRADLPPLEACSVADYGNLFNQDSQERALDQCRPQATRHESATKRQTGWQRKL